MPTDAASAVINQAIKSLKLAYKPNQATPPLGGGSEKVRYFAGDRMPMEAWDAHNVKGCTEPFLWVRLAGRWRTRRFPTVAAAEDWTCALPVVVAVEIGVGRCAVSARPNCTWSDYEAEAEIATDDSWRLENTLCHISGQLRRGAPDPEASLFAAERIKPYGPDGGVAAQLTLFTAQL